MTTTHPTPRFAPPAAGSAASEPPFAPFPGGPGHGIFVTVGAQMPFDRLVSAVDAWAGGIDAPNVFAQIGPGGAEPRHVRWAQFLDPDTFRRCVEGASAIVSHAGMGTILTALEYRKPILVMPRRGDLRETRNDHQVATAERFARLGGIHVAHDERELATWLDHLADLRAGTRVPPRASSALVNALREFVLQDSSRRAVRRRERVREAS